MNLVSPPINMKQGKRKPLWPSKGCFQLLSAKVCNVPRTSRCILALLALATLTLSRVGNAVGPEESPAGPSSDQESNSFPDANKILEGRMFRSTFERDVYFLRTIHQQYVQHWASLLDANFVVKDYVQSPDKLQRFIEELGTAMEGVDDLAAITNLALITSDPEFYANTNAYRPEILRAAGSALIKIGPASRRALAKSFNEVHYRTDTARLGILAETIGQSGILNSNLSAALAATAFTFTATNGGSYPGLTRNMITNLLSLPDGISVVAPYLNPAQLLKDPGRFQAIVDGLAVAHAVELTPNLAELRTQVAAKLKSLPTKPNPYRDDLTDLQERITKAIEQLPQKPATKAR